jgi:hypothetical protein
VYLFTPDSVEVKVLLSALNFLSHEKIKIPCRMREEEIKEVFDIEFIN